MGGGGGGSGPTVQQQQLETRQATTQANLNLEENSQRKAILNAMMGTRVFRGSALSRSVRGNTPGVAGDAAPAPSASQLSNSSPVSTSSLISLLDTRGIGNTSAGGAAAVAGGSTSGGIAGGYSGGGNARGGPTGRA